MPVRFSQITPLQYQAQPINWNALMQGLNRLRGPAQNGLAGGAMDASAPVMSMPPTTTTPMSLPTSTAAQNGPAAIRTNNPGAMWPGPSATRFGSTDWQPVAGGNRIAVFSDPVSGAAAQFDLLGRNYTGMTLSDAVRRWSGGNSSDAYVASLANATGTQPNALLTQETIRNPAFAIPLARAMAQWEAGRPYPLTDEQWQAAHALAFPRY